MRGKEKAMAKIRVKRQKMIVKCGIFLVSIVAVIAMLAPLQLNNPYLHSNDFERVTVRRNDSVWSIASRYTNDNEQVNSLAKAIIEVNALSYDARVEAGQELQVPILKPVEDGLVRMAER